MMIMLTKKDNCCVLAESCSTSYMTACYSIISSTDLLSTQFSLIKAKYHYASLFGDGSELAPNRFGVGSALVRSWLRTS